MPLKRLWPTNLSAHGLQTCTAALICPRTGNGAAAAAAGVCSHPALAGHFEPEELAVRLGCMLFGFDVKVVLRCGSPAAAVKLPKEGWMHGLKGLVAHVAGATALLHPSGHRRWMQRGGCW